MTRKVTIDNILEHDTKINQNLLVVSYRIFILSISGTPLGGRAETGDSSRFPGTKKV